MRKLTIFLLTLSLTGCTKTAHLYPANDRAAEIGVLEARYVAYGTGHTDVEITMPSGEMLKGETSLVRGGTIGFGSVIATAYGSGGYATGNATASNISMPGGSPGKASIFGNMGSYGECEFINDNWSGHGYGACKISHVKEKDQLYKLQY